MVGGATRCTKATSREANLRPVVELDLGGRKVGMKAFTKTRIVIGGLAVLSTMGISSTAFAGGESHSVHITSTPPSNPQVGGTYQVTATGSHWAGPVVINVSHDSSSVCTVSETTHGTATVSFIGAGTCVIYAFQKWGGHDVQVISGIVNPKYAPQHGHGYHGHHHGGRLLGYHFHGNHGNQGNDGRQHCGNGGLTGWVAH